MVGINPDGTLRGKVALVTGASRGIGEAIAVRLAMEGANVVVSARTAEAGESKLPGTLHDTIDRIRAMGGQAAFVKADLSSEADRERLVAEATAAFGPVDRIVASTGQRPDLSLARELRLDLDPWLESTKALGPLIDPNEHYCGSVPPHGHRELAHLEPGFYTVGIKSYGRAPTFLLLTGYEQVRSVAAALAGDIAAADNVQLVLPETGVCVTNFGVEESETSGCCGCPAPAELDACCVADAVAKDEGKTGCGCGVAA